MPEWLPYSGQPLGVEIAELIVNFYADQLGELCAGIQFTLQLQHQDVRLYQYTAKDVRQNWVPKGQDFTLAHVNMANWSYAKVVRFSQRSCTKATGRIVLINIDQLLER